jgi:hypothetical protein
MARFWAIANGDTGHLYCFKGPSGTTLVVPLACIFETKEGAEKHLKATTFPQGDRPVVVAVRVEEEKKGSILGVGGVAKGVPSRYEREPV